MRCVYICCVWLSHGSGVPEHSVKVCNTSIFDGGRSTTRRSSAAHVGEDVRCEQKMFSSKNISALRQISLCRRELRLVKRSRDTHRGDGFCRGHHVGQAGTHDVLLQVFKHRLDAAGNFVHQREHQVQLWWRQRELPSWLRQHSDVWC